MEKRRVILCLDEFDNTAYNDAFPDDFFTLLRGLSQGGNLSLVIATKIPLIEYSAEGMTSPFYNIFSTVTLGPFTREDAGALLTGIAGTAGKTFKPGDVDKALDTVAANDGKYYPWNVQMMGWCWFETGFDLEKAAIKYREALADKKEPGPGPHPTECEEEVLEKMAADTRTVTPPQKPPVTQEKGSDWLPKTAAVKVIGLPNRFVLKTVQTSTFPLLTNMIRDFFGPIFTRWVRWMQMDKNLHYRNKLKAISSS